MTGQGGWERGSLRAGTTDPIGRREALRRAAIVGGAVVWAAPLVNMVGTAGATIVSPPPGPDPTPPPHGTTTTTAGGTTTTTKPGPTTTTTTTKPKTKCWDLKCCALSFKKDSKKYRAKWAGSWVGTSTSLSGCSHPSGWSYANTYSDTWKINVAKNYVDGKLYQVTFTLPSGYTFSNGGGVASAKDSTKYNSWACVNGIVDPGNSKRITFTAPIT
jgi:hypothetical protein